MATVFIEYKSTDERDAEGKLIFEKSEEVINVATIQAQLGSSFRITGIDSAGEARDLALLLRAGALIAPIQIVEERTVGPSLGKENIRLGMQANRSEYCIGDQRGDDCGYYVDGARCNALFARYGRYSIDRGNGG